MLFKPGKNESTHLKCGIYGEAGAGKTFLASKIAIGLHKHIKSKKPVFFFDSEKVGSDFVLKYFEREKIKISVFKSKTFPDLLAATKEIDKNVEIAIIDSVSHPWSELMEGYRKKHKLKFIRLKDWGILKPTWREFSDWFINSNIHVIVCGRAADQFGMVIDEEGVSELQKTGTRMRTEKELGYEPSLLIEVEHHPISATTGARWIHRAWVIKDRADEINGNFFDNAGFNSFLPHIKCLNLGVKHMVTSTQKSSEDMFERGADTGYQRMKMKEILLEKISGEIYKLYPGSDKQSKLDKIRIQEEIFGTNSWKEIETLDINQLDAGYQKLCKASSEKEEE